MRVIPVERVLAGYCHVAGCDFTLGPRAVAPIMVFDPMMFLPAVAARAEVLAAALGHGNDLIQVQRSGPREDSLLGWAVTVEGFVGDGSAALRQGLFLQAAVDLFGLQPATTIDCTEVFKFFHSLGREGIDGPGAESFHGVQSWPLAQAAPRSRLQ